MSKTIFGFNVVSDCCHAGTFRRIEWDFPLGGTTYGYTYGFEACEVCGEECGQLQACEGCGEIADERGNPTCKCETI